VATNTGSWSERSVKRGTRSPVAVVGASGGGGFDGGGFDSRAGRTVVASGDDAIPGGSGCKTPPDSDRGQELAHGRVALLALLGQRLHHHRLELGRDLADRGGGFDGGSIGSSICIARSAPWSRRLCGTRPVSIS
jgi:hypothetical protein